MIWLRIGDVAERLWEASEPDDKHNTELMMLTTTTAPSSGNVL